MLNGEELKIGDIFLGDPDDSGVMNPTDAPVPYGLGVIGRWFGYTLPPHSRLMSLDPREKYAKVKMMVIDL